MLLTLSEGDFSLAWRHSVTKDNWHEFWSFTPKGLHLNYAEVSGPGAGLEIPPDAKRIKGGWRYQVKLPAQEKLVLAASGATGGGWQICQKDQCHNLGETSSEPIVLTTCKP